ncbi:hypothetical protein OROHE_026841 [Orobanche hederae]
MVPLWSRKEFRHTEKRPRNGSVWHFSRNLDVSSNIVQKKRVARILVFKIRPSQEILKIRDGTPLEAEGILTYRKKASKRIEILKIRDGTPLEAEGILTYRKRPQNGSVSHFSSKPFQEILKIRDGTYPFGGGRNSDIQKKALEMDRPSQEILKIRDGTPLEWPSQEILKIRDEILKIRDGTYPFGGGRNSDIQKKALEMDRPSQEILKIRDEPSQEILKIRDEILKIRDGTYPFGGGRNSDIQKKALEMDRFGTFL